MAPVTFENPERFRGSTHWQVKIYDGEPDYEDPHVTILFKEGKSRKAWRINLRTLDVMDANPPKRELPKEFIEYVESNIGNIRKAWNETYTQRRISLADGTSDKKAQALQKAKRRRKKK